MTYKMFLDDRLPVNDGEYVIVRSSVDAINHIIENGMPIYISFDYDLGDGDDAVVFLKKLEAYLGNMKWKIPLNFTYYIHSQNPIGKVRIKHQMNYLLKMYREYPKIEVSEIYEKATDITKWNVWDDVRAYPKRWKNDRGIFSVQYTSYNCCGKINLENTVEVIVWVTKEFESPEHFERSVTIEDFHIITLIGNYARSIIHGTDMNISIEDYCAAVALLANDMRPFK